jgi:hypothetical protein
MPENTPFTQLNLKTNELSILDNLGSGCDVRVKVEIISHNVIHLMLFYA